MADSAGGGGAGQVTGREPFDSSDRGQLQRLAVLDEILPMLSGVLDIREVFVRVSEVAAKVLPHDMMGLLLVDDDGAHVTVHAIRAAVMPEVPARVRIGDPAFVTSPWDHVLIDDVLADPVERHNPAARAGYRSVFRVPLRLRGKFLGALAWSSFTPGFYCSTDLLVAKRLADHAVLALSHHRLAQEQERRTKLQERTASLDLLDQVLAAVTESGQLPEVWERISNVAQKVLAHDALLLSARLPGGEKGRLYAAWSPRSAPFPEYLTVPDSIKRNPGWDHDLVEDLQADPAHQDQESVQLGYRSALRIPLRLDGEFVAALSFLSFTPAAFAGEDIGIAGRVGACLLQSFARERRTALVKRADEATERAARLESRVRELTEELDSRTGYRRVVGDSAPWRQVLTQATQVAATETTALLLGASGTGKEVVARFLHRASNRKNGPFVALNCAALPEQLLEAELFGYERGAFTGAVTSKPGQLEQAAGGTLFLDEVGEMSLPAQAKFLRVLQEREFQRLGGTRALRTDARIVAATNRDLQRAIGNGQFREDLFYRLNVFAIDLPLLRERRDDILKLSEAFLGEIGRSLGRPPAGISRDARQALVEYHWPGNVRELRNVLERAAILCEGGLITAEHLTLLPPAAAAIATEETIAPAADLSSMEKTMIERALRDARFNKSKAARQLGLSRTQLYVRLRRYGLQ